MGHVLVSVELPMNFNPSYMIFLIPTSNASSGHPTFSDLRSFICDCETSSLSYIFAAAMRDCLRLNMDAPVQLQVLMHSALHDSCLLMHILKRTDPHLLLVMFRRVIIMFTLVVPLFAFSFMLSTTAFAARLVSWDARRITHTPHNLSKTREQPNIC